NQHSFRRVMAARVAILLSNSRSYCRQSGSQWDLEKPALSSNTDKEPSVLLYEPCYFTATYFLEDKDRKRFLKLLGETPRLWNGGDSCLLLLYEDYHILLQIFGLGFHIP